MGNGIGKRSSKKLSGYKVYRLILRNVFNT
jgi:hypothetical protein